MAEPYKWSLRGDSILHNLPRQEEDPGYIKTICGVHDVIWTLVNVDLNGHIPQDKLDQINDLLSMAYSMGKRMDFRLREYFRLLNKGIAVESSEFSKEVEDEYIPPNEKAEAKKRVEEPPAEKPKKKKGYK